MGRSRISGRSRVRRSGRHSVDVTVKKSAMPDDEISPAPAPDNKPRPQWLPDTQGFLAVAIIFVITAVVLVLLLLPPMIDDKASGALMTLIGVLVACLKDVYSYFFGSSKGSAIKDDAMIRGALTPQAPTTPPLNPN